MSNNLKGAGYGAIAAVFYGMNPLFALPLYKLGLSTDSVLFYRFSLAAVMLGLILKVTKHSLALKKGELVPLLVFGLFFSSSSLLLYLSFLHMDAGIACTILFLYPVMVAVIMALFFRERASWLTYACIVLAICGVALLYKGEGGETLSIVGILLVTFSALSYSIYMVGINKSSLRNMPVGKLTFWALVFGSLIFVVRLNFLTGLQAIPSLSGSFYILGMALVPTVLSLLFISMAIQYIGSTLTAIIGALEPLTALLIGVVVFHEQITSRIILGVILILVAVILVVSGKPLLNKFRSLLL